MSTVSDGRPLAFADSLAAAWRAGQGLAVLPFDALRMSYACAVRAGALRNSMLAWRDWERLLGALERLLLGPLARRV